MMNSDEALAVYLYLTRQYNLLENQEKVLNQAWGIICQMAEDTIKRESQEEA